MYSFNQNNVKANLHDTKFSRIGVITLSTDFTIEQDFRKICHNLPVDLFFNRIPFLNPLTHENYIKMADHLTEITNQILPNEKIQVVAYGCTSGTIEIGEKRIRSEIFKAKPDALITTPITSAVKALKLLNHKKIAVLTPYPKDVNIKVYNYLIDSGFQIKSFSSFNLEYFKSAERGVEEFESDGGCHLQRSEFSKRCAHSNEACVTVWCVWQMRTVTEMTTSRSGRRLQKPCDFWRQEVPIYENVEGERQLVGMVQGQRDLPSSFASDQTWLSPRTPVSRWRRLGNGGGWSCAPTRSMA